MTNRIVFIAWQLTTRTRTLAQHLSADIISFEKHFANPIFRMFHYLLLALITLHKLFSNKYQIIFVQIPPIQSAVVALFYMQLTKAKIIFDTHSIIFFPQRFHQKLYLQLYRYLIKYPTLNIVHNQKILNYHYLKKSKTVMLEDKLPFNLCPKSAINHKKKIGIICSYHQDEPINEIFKAAESLPEYNFYFTGKSEKIPKPIAANINFTGYLSDDDYEKFLAGVDLIIVLTKRPDTVLCGAYEAVSIGRPLITSNTDALRLHFYKGTIHTTNNYQAIINAIKTAFTNYQQLSAEIIELRRLKEIDWQKQFEVVNNYLCKQ